jgi:polar amino acid transport system substrate-binding protein
MARHLALLLLAPLIGCNLPRDSGDTLHRVQNGTLRAGLIQNPPWVVTNGSVGGVEVELVRRLAGQLGARVDWIPGSESELLMALRERDLDLVVGGLTSKDPWKKRVAFTRQFYTDSVVVSAPAGSDPGQLRGTPVAVEAGTPAIRYLRKKGAVPLVTKDLSTARGAVAAESWLISRIGRRSSGLLLVKAQHVVAVPPGENQWLLRVETFLEQVKATVPTLLQTAQ